MSKSNMHATAAAAGLGAVLAVLAIAPTADAATYYACVKKRGGASRIVSREVTA
jgi:hypothetical protein